MRKKNLGLLILLFFPLLVFSAYSQESRSTSEALNKLKDLPGVKSVQPAANQGRGGAARGEVYALVLEQPVDHQKPDGAKFQQRVFVTHVGYDKPVVLNTEGYAAFGIGDSGELGAMLGSCNVVTVEHRYFGSSVPSPLDWKYLTVKNAADDLHVVVSSLKKLYTGKWISTGTSKGGQTALFYKCYYPEDVNATVAYVAPVNVAQEDPRYDIFINTVSDEATRKKIKEFQIAMFKREAEILPLLHLKEADYSMGAAKAYEYGILEYPYYLWQYAVNPYTVPAPDAPAQVLADHYIKTNTIFYYSDRGKKLFEPFLYQAFTEIGYYNYDITDFKQYMKVLKEPTNLDICPLGTKETIVYNPDTMAFVFNFLQYKAQNVIFIYGDLDIYSATQMQLLGRTNSVKIVVEGQHHGARISSFSPEQKELFYSNLEKWLDMKLTRP
jgi:hypothetical protein